MFHATVHRMRSLALAATIRRSLGLVCLLALVFAIGPTAMPACCDDDCVVDQRACATSCGTCDVTSVPCAMPSKAISPCEAIVASAHIVAPREEAEEILHVPLPQA